MRCLITGVAGFIGSHLAKRLLIEGHEVWGIDSLTDYYPRVLKERNLEGPRSWERFAFIEQDLLTLRLRPLVEGMDWVFHLAAQPGVRVTGKQAFHLQLERNIEATHFLLDACETSSSIKRFIYASSSSVYGQAKRFPIRENGENQPVPLSNYGMTKLAAENMCMSCYHKTGLPVIALRYFTVYGPRQRPDMVLQQFCQSIVEGQALHILGDGYQTRDFTHVNDVVDANLLATRSEAAVGKRINVASGKGVTIREVIDLLQGISGIIPELEFDPASQDEARDTLADISLARRLLGYMPSIELREGLAQQFTATVEARAHRLVLMQQ